MSTAESFDISQHVPLVPPLASGDRLNRIEFERRWEAMPELNRAGLIEGVVHLAAALRYEQHGNPHFNLAGDGKRMFAVLQHGLETEDHAALVKQLQAKIRKA